MEYKLATFTAEEWEVSERSVRNYCAKGRVPGAIVENGSWKIPSDAKKPQRQRRHFLKERTLLKKLRDEKEGRISGGVYHRLQIEMTYNSNHIEGSRLSHDQTKHIFETKTIAVSDGDILVDDVIETMNHFRCIDLVIDAADKKLTESFVKQLHFVLKSSTSDARKSWIKVGDYKLLENEVGGIVTTSPFEVKERMKKLLSDYNSKKEVAIEDIIEFHQKFETIHPFQDGNGRVGRLIMLKECLKHGFRPIVITDENKAFYYRGLAEWNRERGYLIETCLASQEKWEESV